jgi:hypothetical protein
MDFDVGVVWGRDWWEFVMLESDFDALIAAQTYIRKWLTQGARGSHRLHEDGEKNALSSSWRDAEAEK